MSGMLDRLHQRHRIELAVTRRVTRQEMADFAAIALNNAVVNETADMVEGDTRDMEYTRAKFEERLRIVVGPYYIPREERYQ